MDPVCVLLAAQEALDYLSVAGLPVSRQQIWGAFAQWARLGHAKRRRANGWVGGLGKCVCRKPSHLLASVIQQLDDRLGVEREGTSSEDAQIRSQQLEVFARKLD
jgi:hypothetical protein